MHQGIAAILVGIAFDPGLVHLDDVIADVFPEIETTWRESRAHLSQAHPFHDLRYYLRLAHRSIIRPPETRPLHLPTSLTVVTDVLQGSKRVSDPGAVYNYDNTLPFLLACYLDRKTGQSVESFAQNTSSIR